MRKAASCCQPLQEISVPRAARKGPRESAAPAATSEKIVLIIERLPDSMPPPFYSSPPKLGTAHGFVGTPHAAPARRYRGSQGFCKALYNLRPPLTTQWALSAIKCERL